MRKPPARQKPRTWRDVLQVEKLPNENQEWQVAWERTYERLNLTMDESFELWKLLSKIRWGFTSDDLEDMPPKDRKCLFAFRKIIVGHANRIVAGKSTGGMPVPDPKAAGYMGGRRPKIPPRDHAVIRMEVARLIQGGMPKRKALLQVKRERGLTASTKTLERICQDRTN
jgi:hypothetical protein